MFPAMALTGVFVIIKTAKNASTTSKIIDTTLPMALTKGIVKTKPTQPPAFRIASVPSAGDGFPRTMCVAPMTVRDKSPHPIMRRPLRCFGASGCRSTSIAIAASAIGASTSNTPTPPVTTAVTTPASMPSV